MSPFVPQSSSSKPTRRPLGRQAASVVLALSAAVIAACGGGGGSEAITGASSATTSGTSTSGSTSSTSAAAERATAYAAGPISGFGSVIVNGVRYDDSAATVTDDDNRSSSRDSLKLGMMVALEGSEVSSSSATGRALRIRFGSEIIGPVSAVDTAASTLTVLGQTVKLTSTTVFDDSITGGLAALAVGNILEIHAQFNATDGSYTAMRVEKESTVTTYKLRGLVANLNTTAKTFSIGGQVINYAAVSASALPTALANGLSVGVRLQTAQVNGQWVATAVSDGTRKPVDGAGAHLRGAITVFTSATSFEINGIKVDAATASFPDGQTGIVLGAVVEVKGATVNGVVVATQVELDSRHAEDRHRFELHGTISALNTAAKTFKLRTVTVNYSGTGIEWKDGAEANLADGKSVEVKGTPSADRTQLMATKIEFE